MSMEDRSWYVKIVYEKIKDSIENGIWQYVADPKDNTGIIRISGSDFLPGGIDPDTSLAMWQTEIMEAAFKEIEPMGYSCKISRGYCGHGPFHAIYVKPVNGQQIQFKVRTQ